MKEPLKVGLVEEVENARIENARQRNFRLEPGAGITTYEDACAFVEETGIVMPWATRGLVMPSLRAAYALPVKREPGPIWDWKDRMHVERRAFYGRLLGEGFALATWEYMPAFLRLAGRTPPESMPGGSRRMSAEADFGERYEAGMMPSEARRVMDALLDAANAGGLSTASLRAAAGLRGKESKARFERAMQLLQKALFVTKVAVRSDARYTYIWGLVDDWIDGDVWQKVSPLDVDAARTILARRYLGTVVFADAGQVARVFGWTMAEARTALERLAAEGVASTGDKLGLPTGVFVWDAS